jgi:hypothetical protein
MRFGLCVVCFSLLFFISFSLLMMSKLTPNQPNHAKIRSAGQEAKAEVVSVETVRNVDINGVNPRRIVFRYEVDGRMKQYSMDTMPSEETSDWKPGHQITIRYLGDEATIPSLQPLEFPMFLFLLMPVVFLSIGLPFLVYGIFRARRKLRVMRFGIVKKAQLLSLTPLSGYAGWFVKTRFEATYVFRGSNGNDVYGRSFTTDLVLLNEKKKGDEVEILILPDNEQRSQVLDAPTLAKVRTA